MQGDELSTKPSTSLLRQPRLVSNVMYKLTIVDGVKQYAYEKAGDAQQLAQDKGEQAPDPADVAHEAQQYAYDASEYAQNEADRARRAAREDGKCFLGQN